MKSNYFFKLLILIGIIYSLTFTNLEPNISVYSGREQHFNFIVENIDLKDSKLTILLKGPEKVLGIYYLDKEKINLQIGDTITVSGKLSKPNNNTIPNLFNYKNYLNNKKIYWILKIDKIDKIKSSNNFFTIIKNKIINRCNKMQSSTYLKTFILGNDSSIDKNVKESYQSNGVTHLFALSGMHVSLITTILFFIFNKLKLTKPLIKVFSIVVLLFYAVILDISPSIIRAILFFILIQVKDILKLKYDNFSILSVTFFIMIFLNPYYIYDLGFQYSFTITFFLIQNQHLIKKCNNKLTKVILISTISFLASLPINIYNFFNINLLSIVINLIFVPFITIVIFPLSFLTFIFSFLDPILYFLLSLMEKLSLFLKDITYLNFTLARPNIIVIFLYYLLIRQILKLNYKSLIIFLICLIIHNNISFFNLNGSVIILDVKGESILISLPHNKANILIDTGGTIFQNQNYKSNIPLYLKSIGVKKIDYLITTHGDYDHIGEAVHLVNNFKVKQVIFNKGNYNELELKLIKVLKKKKIPYYKDIKELNIDKYKLYFLNTKEYDNENDNSNVIYVNLNSYKFLFMGDAGIEKEKDLIEKYNLNEIDILKIGHHGSKTSTGEYFVDKINAKYSIISVNKNNIYGHPNKEVLEILKNSKIYRTDINGSIIFKIEQQDLKIKTYAP